MGPGNQLSKPAGNKSLLQAEVCPESFVERVFVKDHAGRFLGAVGWPGAEGLKTPTGRCFYASRNIIAPTGWLLVPPSFEDRPACNYHHCEPRYRPMRAECCVEIGQPKSSRQCSGSDHFGSSHAESAQRAGNRSRSPYPAAAPSGRDSTSNGTSNTMTRVSASSAACACWLLCKEHQRVNDGFQSYSCFRCRVRQLSHLPRSSAPVSSTNSGPKRCAIAATAAPPGPVTCLAI